MSKGVKGLLMRGPLHFVLILLALVWMLPTVGLLITSFRPPQDVGSTGWWTVLAHPFNFTQYTLENYGSVITEGGMGRAFLNSLIITVPATLFPILLAAFAAFAFAWTVYFSAC